MLCFYNNWCVRLLTILLSRTAFLKTDSHGWWGACLYTYTKVTLRWGEAHNQALVKCASKTSLHNSTDWYINVHFLLVFSLGGGGWRAKSIISCFTSGSSRVTASSPAALALSSLDEDAGDAPKLETWINLMIPPCSLAICQHRNYILVQIKYHLLTTSMSSTNHYMQQETLQT